MNTIEFLLSCFLKSYYDDFYFDYVFAKTGSKNFAVWAF